MPSHTTLAEIYLTFSDAPDPLTWRNRLSSILARVPKTLRHFNFCLEKNLPPPIRRLADLFEPCLAFPDITAFELELFTNTPHVSDADLLQFATAWPKLRFFSVSHELLVAHPRTTIRTAQQARPTLNSLINLAQLCPSLYSLYIPTIDVSTIPSKDSVPVVRQTALRNLQVRELHGGRIANLLDVAVIINMLFPRVETHRSVVYAEQTISTRPYPPPSESRTNPWGLTRVLLSAMQARREQEELDSPRAASPSSSLDEDEDEEFVENMSIVSDAEAMDHMADIQVGEDLEGGDGGENLEEMEDMQNVLHIPAFGAAAWLREKTMDRISRGRSTHPWKS
ncbi:hypothetical protein BV20DRAFT_971432 [Pilatotrama ljubarskyi]|nr:hypothetical protein BV20DRAFT_971432 [Pilatotrama ljubarskyi]